MPHRKYICACVLHSWQSNGISSEWIAFFLYVVTTQRPGQLAIVVGLESWRITHQHSPGGNVPMISDLATEQPVLVPNSSFSLVYIISRVRFATWIIHTWEIIVSRLRYQCMEHRLRTRTPLLKTYVFISHISLSDIFTCRITGIFITFQVQRLTISNLHSMHISETGQSNKSL